MSTNVGSIHYDLKLNTSQFDKATQGLTGRLNSIGDKMSSIGKKMTASVTLPVVAGFGFAIKAASDLNETINKVDVSFRDQAKTVHDWSKTSLKSMGLAQGSALDAAALFGDMSTSMGLNTKEAASMSTKLVQLGADMASFKNVSFDRAQTALAAVYTGETEALKSLGIVMTETNLKAFAQSQGIKKNIQDMTQAEKVQLRFAYVMDVTKNAQGDFARTITSTANQIRLMSERSKQLSAELGLKMLDTVNKVLAALSSLLDKFSKLSPQMQKAILITAALAAVLGPLAIVIGTVIKVVIGLRAAFILLAAHPIVAILLGIAAVLMYLQVRFNWVGKAVNLAVGAFNSLKTVGRIVIAALRGVVSVLWRFYGPFVDAGWGLITAFANGIKGAFTKVYNTVKDGMNRVKNLLPGSDAKEGPLSNLTQSGRAFSETFAKGIMQGRNSVHSAANAVLGMGAAGVGGTSGVGVNTTISGPININNRQDADYFFGRLNRNSLLDGMGVAPV